MWSMLPIPAPIIGLASAKAPKNDNNNTINITNTSCERNLTNRKFFIPLIYLGGSASLCYLFLFAFIVGNEKAVHHHPHHLIPHRQLRNVEETLQGNSKKDKNSEKQFYLSGLPKEGSFERSDQRNRKEGRNEQLSSSTATATATLHPHFHRKVIYSLRKKSGRPKNKQNGTRRSDPPKIWSGHQDLDQLLRLTLTSQLKNDLRSKPSSGLEETYIYPWIEDAECKKFKVRFAKRDTFKTRALVSFPGSGNTWIRYLIERASGYFTGSVYNDKSLFESGLLGELRKPDDGTTILQKTHYNTARINKVYHEKEAERIFGYRGILILRNPFDALVSYWNFVNTLSKNRHTGRTSESDFKSKKWINFVLTRIPIWTSLITSWIKNSSDYLIILYEDVEKNPRAELIRILKYLNQTVDAARLDCLMKPKHLEGPFHRAHPPPGEKALLSKDVPLTGSTTSSSTTTSLQERNWKMSPSSSSNKNNLRRNDEQRPSSSSSSFTTLSHLDSKQSQHPQSPSSLLSSSLFLSTRRTSLFQGTTTGAGAAAAPKLDGGKKEQKEEDLFSLSFLSLSSSPPALKTISSTSSPKKHHQQNQDRSSTSSNSSRTMTRSNDNLGNNHNSNNGPNNSSILRLDLIIQDNIDQINRFFQQKSIPVQLFYFPRPSTIPYFLPTYNPSTFSV